jgi:hypothetical protein
MKGVAPDTPSGALARLPKKERGAVAIGVAPDQVSW